MLARLGPNARGVAEQEEQAALSRTGPTSVGRRAAGDASWALVGSLVSRGTALAGSVALARLLGREAFGQYGILQGTVGAFQIFATFGLGLTATKYVAQYRENSPRRAASAILLTQRASLMTGAACAALAIALAQPIATGILAEPRLADPLRIASVGLVFLALIGSDLGVLAGLRAFRTSAGTNAVQALLVATCAVAGAALAGVSGAMAGTTIGLAVSCVVARWGSRCEAVTAGIATGNGAQPGETLRMLADFSLPAVLAAAVVTLANWASSAILVNGQAGYVQMGIHNLANQWLTAVLFLPGVVGQVLVPLFAEASQGGRKSPTRLALRATGLYALLAVPIGVAGVALAPRIAGLYGSEFADGTPVLVVAFGTAVLAAVEAPLGYMLAGTGRMWVAMFLNAAWAGVFCGLSVAWVSRGALGIGVARLVAYGIHGVLSAILLFALVREGSTRPSFDRGEHP